MKCMQRLFALVVILIYPVVCGAEPATQPALRRWSDGIAAEKLTVLESSPFILIGDGGSERLAQYRDHTVRAAAEALWATYFDQRPTESIVIFLFESDERYRRLSRDWFAQPDPPHFGYCRRDGVMVMNIATGTGTLVHELTHALIRFDFPTVPPWFNEGLASLYEQCQINGKTMTGLKNWRLPALQKAIRENTLRPLRELIHEPDFYDETRSGLNYAQARYLMMYLQEKQTLQKLYDRFREHQAEDANGWESLRAVVAPESEEAFESGFRQWVLQLR